MINQKVKRIQLIEMWDALLFKAFNFISWVGYICNYRKIKKIIRRNKELKGLHKGEICFIVFGGTSLDGVDLSFLRDETVCCVNHFYNTTEYEIIHPNYYFASDTHIFSSSENHIERIINKTKGESKCIFSHHAIPHSISAEHVYITYSRHKPTHNNVRSNLVSLSSNFGSVSMFAINCAIYMGFKEIYLLGYDFPPGNMPHFYKESEIERRWRNKRKMQNDMYDVCERHWQYSQAQFENYYLAEHAIKNNVSVYNCNINSNVRSFEFMDIEQVCSNL